jgi:multisubunit Na+/H+ antiporter MnhF subunit
MIEIFPLVIGLLSASFALIIWRLLRGHSLADILLAFSVLGTVGVGVLLMLAQYEHELFADVAIPLALLSIVGVLMVCRYLEGRIEIAG